MLRLFCPRAGAGVVLLDGIMKEDYLQILQLDVPTGEWSHIHKTGFGIDKAGLSFWNAFLNFQSQPY